MKQIIVQSLVSSTQTAVIKGNKLVELLIEDNIHNKILVASIRAFSNKVYVQKLIEFNEEEQKETLCEE